MTDTRAERRLTTILAADVVGYSRLMAADEAGTPAPWRSPGTSPRSTTSTAGSAFGTGPATLDALKTHRRELIEPKAAEYNGRVVKLMGDGTLMEFARVVDAETFAVEVQRAMAERNAGVAEDQRIAYRIGINIGDVIIEGDDIYGDGVNVAARLEALAEPGDICISRSVHTQVKGKVDLAFADLGEQQVKNIPEGPRISDAARPRSASAHVCGLELLRRRRRGSGEGRSVGRERCDRFGRPRKRPKVHVRPRGRIHLHGRCGMVEGGSHQGVRLTCLSSISLVTKAMARISRMSEELKLISFTRLRISWAVLGSSQRLSGLMWNTTMSALSQS